MIRAVSNPCFPPCVAEYQRYGQVSISPQASSMTARSIVIFVCVVSQIDRPERCSSGLFNKYPINRIKNPGDLPEFRVCACLCTDKMHVTPQKGTGSVSNISDGEYRQFARVVLPYRLSAIVRHTVLHSHWLLRCVRARFTPERERVRGWERRQG